MVDRENMKAGLALTFTVLTILPQLSHAAAHRTPTYQSPPVQRDSTYVSTYDQYCSGCSPTQYVIGLSGGPLFNNSGETQVIFLEPDVQKTYVADSSSRTNAAFEVFLGIDHEIEPAFRGQIGLALSFAGSKLHGHIWEDSNQLFDDFTYDYSVRNTRYAAKGKAIIDTWRGWGTYLSGSAGVAVNTAHNFNITPIIPEAVPAPRFTSNTELSFSYSLGAGFQHTLGHNWQAGIGYEFADWGKSSLSRAPGQTLSDGIGSPHLYTSEIVLFINYMIPCS